MTTSDTKFQMPLLDETNYGNWVRRVRAFLLSRQLWKVVSGEEEDKEKSDQALGYIQLYLSEYYGATADDVATAKGLWEKLENSFKTKNNARRLLLRQELTNLRKKPSETVTEYLARARELASNLEAVGHKPEPTELTLPVLAGLPKDYSVLVTILGTSKEEHELDDILPMLLQMEQQLNREEETVPIYAAMRNMSVNDRRQPRGNQQPRGDQQPRGNQQRRGSGRKSSGSRRITGTCFYCNKPGHMQADCRERAAYQQRDNQFTVAFGASLQQIMSKEWIIDSGASRHLTFDKQQLHSYRSIAPGTAITFVNGQQAEAVGEGEVHLQVKTTRGTVRAVLQKVLHVPEARVNLFSTRQATDSGAQVLFSSNKCFVSINGTVCMEGINQSGLMIIKQSESQAAFAMAAAAATTKETAELWHRRFGHLGYDSLYKLKSKDMVEGISVPAQDFKLQQEQRPFCETCTFAKQQRLAFPHSDSTSSDVLELLHMDVCGPMQVSSPGGAKYLATFTDDYSRLAVVIPLAAKSDVPGAVKEIISKWETQTGKSLKAVRTDRGTEYLNSELHKYFRSKGIIHNTTAPYTPEQNGVAERFNRTLMERVRAMLSDAKLEEEYWADAAITATFVRNRSPSRHGTQTPWELFYGRKPDVSGMRVFGAKAYVPIPKQLRRKLDSVSQEGTFVGYEPNSKAYRVLLHSGKVEVSRDVVFAESLSGTDARPEPTPVTTSVEAMPPSPREDNVDYGPTYSTDSETAEADTQQAQEIPAADTAAQTVRAIRAGRGTKAVILLTQRAQAT